MPPVQSPPRPLLRLLSPSFQTHIHHQIRHATLIRRAHRPYTFTQLLTLSDGSTFTHRTTSPAPIYRSTRDARNTPLWNPSNTKLANVEEDEAGRLKAFRRRFGRGWDVEENVEEEGGAALGVDVKVGEKGRQTGTDSAMPTTPSPQSTTGTSPSPSSGSSPASSASPTGSSSSYGDNLMDLISNYAQGSSSSGTPADPAKSLKGAVRKAKK